MTKIVKYHSDINKIPLRKFNEKEINLFFSLVFKAKQEGSKKIKINFTDLRKISNGDINNPRFIKSLKNLNRKLLNLNQEITLPDGKIVMFNLFNRFVIDPVNKDLEIQIGDDFYYMLNDLLVYTQFELEQLVSFKSSYSKNIFRLLKQFESTKFFIKDFNDFKKLLCIPETYRNYDIDRRVFNPSMRELLPIFPNLKLEKIKKGRKIDQVKFTWGNRCSIENTEDQSVIEIKISEQLNKIIEKTKKNRFIQPLLSVSNIEKLIKKYSEDRLIKGLNFATQEIKYEIKSLSYLEKTIDTGIEASKKKIIIKKVPQKPIKDIQPNTSIEPKEHIKKEAIEEIREPAVELNSELKEFKKEIENLAKKKLKNKFYPFKSKLIFANTEEKLIELIEEYKLGEL